MSNIHIPRKHASAPKETEAEKAIREARQDIADGTFVPETKQGMESYFDEGENAILAQHPRVQEALAKLKHQVSDKTQPEYLEKAEQLHQMNCAMRAKGKWEGQERWQGMINREKRMVNPINPFAFIKKLRKAGVRATNQREGNSQVWLGSDVVKLQKDKSTGLVGVYALLTGQAAREAHFGVIQAVKNTNLLKLDAEGVRIAMSDFNEAVAGYKSHRPAAVRINSLQAPWGYEWTVMRFDEYDCPTVEEFHGWRTAVLALILRGVITEQQAIAAFGEPSGDVADFYSQQLQQHRKHTAAVDEQWNARPDPSADDLDAIAADENVRQRTMLPN